MDSSRRDSSRDRHIAAVRDVLRLVAANDYLKLTSTVISSVAISGGLEDPERAQLLTSLYRAAIVADSSRLLRSYRASGNTAVPIPRLVAAWGKSVGVPATSISEIALNAAGPIDLVREFLRAGRIDSAKLTILSKIAGAYAADEKLASNWIGRAVEAEIDQRSEDARRRNARQSWWRRAFDNCFLLGL